MLMSKKIKAIFNATKDLDAEGLGAIIYATTNSDIMDVLISIHKGDLDFFLSSNNLENENNEPVLDEPTLDDPIPDEPTVKSEQRGIGKVIYTVSGDGTPISLTENNLIYAFDSVEDLRDRLLSYNHDIFFRTIDSKSGDITEYLVTVVEAKINDGKLDLKLDTKYAVPKVIKRNTDGER